MALFRDSQSYDSRINSFYDLPDMQWHGSTLYDKKTFDVISGYNLINIPIINNNSIPPITNLDHTIISKYTTNGMFKYNTPIPNNFTLTQHAYMNSNLYPHQYIPNTNIINDIQKAYVIDPDDPDMVYFIATTSYCDLEASLVKFNYKIQEIVWIKKLLTQYLYNNETNTQDGYFSNASKYRIWKIKNGMLYIIAETNTAYSSKSNNYQSLANNFLVINGENGEIAKRSLAVLINEDITSYDAYASPNYYGITSFTCSNSMVYIADLNDEEALFFTNLFTTKPYSNANNTYNEKITINNNDAFFKASYIIYNYKSHNVKIIEGRNITKIKDLVLSQQSITFNNDTESGKYIHIPKVSQVDKTIKDKYVVYSCWGELINLCNRQDNDTEFRTIYKFEFDKETNSQTATRMKVINSDGTDFILKNWRMNKNKSDLPIYSQPYIIYGNNDKKYLMIYDNYTESLPVKQDMLTFTHLFKFIDNNTLQLVDQIPFAITDLFFAKDDVFIGLREDKIRFYKIDYTNDKFDNFKSIQPEKIGNKFLFACIDDMGNFWYYEGISALHNRNIQNFMRLNYINSYTVNRIELVKEKDKFEYNNTDIDSYINLSVISDYDDIIERDIEITILGNAKFKENSTKYLKTKSISGVPKKIEFTITGTGEIIFNANLTKE